MTNTRVGMVTTALGGHQTQIFYFFVIWETRQTMNSVK